MGNDKFQNKYRIDSARLQNWDYTNQGMYFITICTKNREHYFGEIENNKMILSNAGVIADLMWYEIKNHTKNIELGEFVIMPNHIHGILIITDNESVADTTTVETLHVVETLHATSLHATSLQHETPQPPTIKNEQMAKISPKSNSISTIVRSYKSAVTKHAHRLGFDFAWQTRFHDHIIRDQKSFDTITNYIITNPLNWENDKFHGNE